MDDGAPDTLFFENGQRGHGSYNHNFYLLLYKVSDLELLLNTSKFKST